MWNEELKDDVAYNPILALERAQAGQTTIEGLVPRGGVTWLYGPSMSFKSFIVMSMAAAVSSGSIWMGRRTEESVVVYVGAEGGDALHVRRAAAEIANKANRAGVIVVAQDRPLLDEATGLARMRGVLDGVRETVWGEVASPWADTPHMRAAAQECKKGLGAMRTARGRLQSSTADAAAKVDELLKLSPEHAGKRDRFLEKHQKDFKEAAMLAVAEAEKNYREAKTVYEGAERQAEAEDPQRATYQRVKDAYAKDTALGFNVPHRNVCCIIDTYAQTAGDDNRASVSAYIKNLRTLIEDASSEGVSLTFIVVDHVTKEGSTYLGSVAKLNDVDSQIEVSRLRKTMLASVTQTKSKDAAECAPVNVEMRVLELAGYNDAMGRPLSTLVARDGAQTAAVAALNPEGNSAMILELLQGAEGLMPEVELKAAFRGAKIVAGVKPESADKAYRRAMQALRDDGCIRDMDGEISLR